MSDPSTENCYYVTAQVSLFRTERRGPYTLAQARDICQSFADIGRRAMLNRRELRPTDATRPD
ncbi:MAG: hypothetical protein AAFV85_12590 [Cyanobacteria bacterium J06634_6]